MWTKTEKGTPKKIQIDKEDFKLLKEYNWSANKFNRTTYYVAATFKGRTIYLHRLIMNAPKGMQVDHINGDGLDNRKINLRVCTRSENLRNSYRHRKGHIIGTYYTHNGFVAQARVNGKVCYIGRSKTKKGAHKLWLEFQRTLVKSK